MADEKGLDYLFNDVPLYTKETFKVFSLKDEKYEVEKVELNKMLWYLGINNERLITYCHKCKKEFPFIVDVNCVRSLDGKRVTTESLYFTSGSNNSSGAYIVIDNGKIYGPQPPYAKEKLLNNTIWYFQYFFSCTNNQDHTYMMMVSLELKNGEFYVRKIGQNPSMLTIKGFDFDKYKNELEIINAYVDYKKADLSFADHFYVGAYAYLRRIFEKMIAKYLEGVTTKDNRMDTKIEAAKERFDPRIKGMLSNLYGILSISIHELDEDQSKDYYIYLKAIIDIQLEFERTEREKENQTKSLSSILGKINSELGKHK